MNSLFLKVEVPIDAHDAKRRRIPLSLAKLLMGMKSPNNSCLALAEIIWDSRNDTETLYAYPLNLYDSIGNKLNEDILDRNIRSVGCEEFLYSIETCQGLLSIFDADLSEAWFLVFSENENVVLQVIENIKKDKALTGQYELPFLRSLECLHALMFYSLSHRSVEILGEPKYVYNRFAVPWIGRLTQDLNSGGVED